MKNYLILLLIVNFTKIEAQEAIENSWFKNNMFEVKSIDPTDENFDDLSFLKPILKDKTIILLGEEEHTFATTSEAKSRLIKFLHQELGFTVLAFELDLYSIWKINQMKPNKSSKLLPIQQNIYPFWGRTTSTEELFKYIDSLKSSDNKINYIGFDNQITGQFNFFSDLEKLLLKNESEIPSYKNYKKFKEVFKKSYSYPNLMGGLNLEDYALLVMFIDDILFELDLSVNKTEEVLIISRALINIKQDMHNKIIAVPTADYHFGNLNPTDSIYGFLGDEKSMGNLNRRDKQMSEMIMWIKEKLYPNQKIIIWGHSEHTMYNRNKVKKVFPPDITFHLRFTYGYAYKNTGMYLKEMYGNELYNLGFSTINGEVDFSRNMEVKYLTKIDEFPSSVEEIVKASDFNYPFLNFYNTRKKIPKQYFNSTMISNVLQGKETFGDISKFFDGILFIRNAKPITYINPN